MDLLLSHRCPLCGEEESVQVHSRYPTKNNGMRTIYRCRYCDIYYSETFGSAIAGLTTPLSRIIEILTARSEGMSLNGPLYRIGENLVAKGAHLKVRGTVQADLRK